LPESLKILEFKKNSVFNGEIRNFPRSLLKLEFGSYFNKPLFGLQDGLKILAVDICYPHINNIPDSIELLRIGNYLNEDERYCREEIIHDIHKLPRNLKYLITYRYSPNYEIFMNLLKNAEDYYYFNNPIIIDINDDIPRNKNTNLQNLHYLDFGSFLQNVEYNFENTECRLFAFFR
jgi:hypothetical protein